eukprot:3041609-Pleurochrysis_carterae.AAC.3
MALSCSHEGKHLGSRGHALSDKRETNMYVLYSWHIARLEGNRTSCTGHWVLTLVASPYIPWSDKGPTCELRPMDS